LYNRCVVDGRSSSKFMPDNAVSRAELVKVVLNTYNTSTAPWQNIYSDIPKDEWFADYITKASKLGIVNCFTSGDGTSIFKPNQPVTRAEALKIMLKTKGVTNLSGYTTTFADVKKGDWFYDFVAYAETKGLIEGYTETFNYDGPVSKFYSLQHNLSLGVTGEDVQNLKKILRQLGYFTGNVNNVFDDSLKNAVIKFQAENGIPQTGNLGPLTRDAILNTNLKHVVIKFFMSGNNITRAEALKMDLSVEKNTDQ